MKKDTPNATPKLYLELEAIVWEFNMGTEFDKASYHTIQRVQQKMYEPPHIKEAMQKLTDEERMEIMNEFCKHCGSLNSGCQCWNDE